MEKSLKDLLLKTEKCKGLLDWQDIPEATELLEKLNFNTLSIFLFFTSCGDIPFDTSERGGVMMATDDKTIIIESLAKAYTEGNFDMAKDYFANFQ